VAMVPQQLAQNSVCTLGVTMSGENNRDAPRILRPARDSACHVSQFAVRAG